MKTCGEKYCKIILMNRNICKYFNEEIFQLEIAKILFKDGISNNNKEILLRILNYLLRIY